MKPSVNITSDDKTILKFTLKDVDVSIVNGLRRTLLENIPTAVFEKSNIEFISNTSRLNNEILNHRLTLIPIFINNLTIPLEDYVVEINYINTGTTLQLITTEHFKIKNIKQDKYLTPKETQHIFPKNPITGDYILFCKLRPPINKSTEGEQINIKAKISISSAAHSAAYNVASTVSYYNTPDFALQERMWNKQTSTESKEDWLCHHGFRYFIPNSYNFIIETLGVFTNAELISKACTILQDKFKLILENDPTYIPSKTTLPFSFDITLKNEDYTIGKILEYILYSDFEKKILSYVGFNKEHPHNLDSIIRIAFTKDNQEVLPLITKACTTAIQLFQDIKEQFISPTTV